jgi:hypothetical protein
MSILDRRDPRIDLPRAWPRIAKSAIVHALALAHLVITHVRGWCADSPLRRVRLASECERLRSEVAMLREELRIKDARLARIPPRNRPHYPPAERLAILALRAARGWNTAQTASRFLVEPATIANWMGRIDEEGPDALVRTPAPVNRFPEFVGDIVRRLKATFPALGSQRIANMLARAGLHVARTTVRRLLKIGSRPTEPIPSDAAAAVPSGPATTRRIISRGPNHTWLVDLTIMPTAAGFWVPWLPFALVQRWPFCWWVAVVNDHFSRTVVGHAVFKQQPSAAEVLGVLDVAIAQAGRAPKYVISDQGSQFRDEYRAWCVLSLATRPSVSVHRMIVDVPVPSPEAPPPCLQPSSSSSTEPFPPSARTGTCWSRFPPCASNSRSTSAPSRARSSGRPTGCSG